MDQTEQTQLQLNADEPNEHFELLPQLMDAEVRATVRRSRIRWAFTFTFVLVAFIEGVQLHRECAEEGIPNVAVHAGKRGFEYVRTVVLSVFRLVQSGPPW